ncbi:MAG: tetratricopeptide repeat protein, partial [Anaerolineae bacterium]
MQDILTSLELTPADVPNLPAKARSALLACLLRWEHWDAARRCLHQLLVSHSHLVSVYDDLARAYLGLGQPDRALEMMDRRHALRASNSSRILEAKARLAAGDLASAQAIARELTAEQPDMLSVWSLQADLCLAAGDFDGVETALQQRETLRPEAVATALGLARLWLARGDVDKALLWARTALARTERDERAPAIELLRLLERLYRATGQAAQAGATAADLHQRQQQDLDT